jgi:hypothetical protein
MLSLSVTLVGVLAVVYLALIAVVMNYAALTVEFSQSVKNDEAALSVLESQYLARVASIQGIDYRALGYAAPTAKLFVPATSVTALR